MYLNVYQCEFSWHTPQAPEPFALANDVRQPHQRFKHNDAMALSCLLRKAIKGSSTSSWVLRLSLDMSHGVAELYKAVGIKGEVTDEELF